MRIRIYVITVLLAMAGLVTGLAHIQLGRHERYSSLSENNRLKVVPLMAPRGSILDRNGVPVAKDVLSFNAAVIYSRIKNKEAVVDVLSQILDIPSEDVIGQIKESRRMPYSPHVVLENIGIEKAIRLEEGSRDYPGLLLEVSAIREYVFDETASNILGYIGSINRAEFDRMKHYGYRMNDKVGRAGVEKYYDDYLRGRHGGKQIEVDHRGRHIYTLGYRQPVPGKNVILTIDIELQEFCDELLEGKKGAIIAMDPRTGAVYAMASAPGYDPGIFVDRRRSPEIKKVLRDRDYPMLNRAISGTYPPGSVFKAVIAAAALEENAISEDTTFECPGSLTLGGRTFHCWKKSGHGIQYMAEAIKNSCNVFFWRTGLRLGVEKIARYAGMFGIGKKTGIDLPAEKAGLLPSPRWKRKALNKPWYKGETLNYSVGQGYLLASPLQMARLMSVFASGGYMVRPFVVSMVGGVPVNSVERDRVDISTEHMEAVRLGLKKVVNDRRGTGMKARLKDVVVAGKTGTAQTSRGKNHGWFAGFAPFDDPVLAVVVFDEYGGKGGYYAAGTAGEVFEKAGQLGLLETEQGDASQGRDE
ncbi:MAG: penicillin-binding protein 2 [Candidatus Omnitrophica bacterium]|nr:penicillin-binding protein 2 [Candidatus Omnitrophota bacterium]